jgi:ankyrin repeat protein
MKKLKIICIVSLLLSAATFAQKPNIFHERNFWKANPSIELIDEKNSKGNNISELNSNAFDAVVYAILENTDNNTIKYLLSKEGNGVNKKTHDGRTYIFWAAYKNNIELMKYLVSKDARTNIVDDHGYTILNFAASTGQTNTKIYDYLIKISANIKTDKNRKGANVLLLVAPYLENYSLVNYLLSKGASLEDKDNNGNGVFEYAAKGGNISFLKTLIDKGVTKGENTMIFASQGIRRKKNTLQTYKFLESVGVKTNCIDKDGKNPLHAIAYNNKDLATYSYFISKGVKVNLQDNKGRSPFMNAAKNNTLEIVKFLSKETTNINSKDKKGRSALIMSVQSNTKEVVNFLLEMDANINTEDADGNTLSYYLINIFKTTEFEDKLSILEKNGLIINKLQHSKNTLLHIAVRKDNLALLKRLNSFNIDVNAQNKDELSALQIAAMKTRSVEILEYLLTIGAHKNIKTAFNETIYDLASENELLINNNINFLK